MAKRPSPPPMPRINAAIILGPIFLLVTVIGYVLWWFHLATLLRNGVDAWAAQRRAEGWMVEIGKPAVTGFPRTVEMRLAQPGLVLPGGVTWNGPPVTLTLRPEAPGAIDIAAAGRHRLEHRGEVMTLSAESLGLTIALAGGAAESVLVRGRGLALHPTAGEPVGVEHLRLLVDPLPLPPAADHTTPSLTLTAEAQGLSLPPTSQALLGRRIQAMALEARVLGQIPAGALVPALRGWSDSGGRLEVDRIGLTWEPLSVSGSGTLALDPGTLQPIAAFSASIRGFFEAIDVLADAQMIRSRDATMAKLILGALAKTPAEGGAPVISVPVTVQNGSLSVGPAALLKIPPIPWQTLPGGK